MNTKLGANLNGSVPTTTYISAISKTVERCLWYIEYAKRYGRVPAYVAMERWDISLRTFHRDASRLRGAGYILRVDSGTLWVDGWNSGRAA